MYLLNRLKAIDGIENVRGRGLMMASMFPERLKDLRAIASCNAQEFISCFHCYGK